MEKEKKPTSTEETVKNDSVEQDKGDIDPKLSSKREASWPSVLFYIHLNILGLYGIIVLFTQTKLITILFSKVFKFFSFNKPSFVFWYDSKSGSFRSENFLLEKIA